MRTEKQHLELLFQDEGGKSRKISIANPKPDLNPVATRAAMQAIAGAEIFHNEFGVIYAQVDGARYVTRTVEPIFASDI